MKKVFSHIIKYQDYDRQRRVALTLWLLAGLLIACYIYLVNSTIFKAVSRQNDLEALALGRSAVINLEQSYLQLSGQITLEHAYELGFRDAEQRLLGPVNPAFARSR